MPQRGGVLKKTLKKRGVKKSPQKNGSVWRGAAIYTSKLAGADPEYFLQILRNPCRPLVFV
jgi:hypothetical protein